MSSEESVEDAWLWEGGISLMFLFKGRRIQSLLYELVDEEWDADHDELLADDDELCQGAWEGGVTDNAAVPKRNSGRRWV